RHTRSKRDWSSDVCSSDLVTELNVDIGRRLLDASLPARDRHSRGIELLTQLRLAYAHAAAESNDPGCPFDISFITTFLTHTEGRSEERRVGKECRWQWVRT